MVDDVATAALRARVAGRARTGTVSLRDFDKGVVETLGAREIKDSYFIVGLDGVDCPPEAPGLPVVFSHPEDVFQRYKIPIIEVRRDDITPAMNRWHPGTGRYNVPAYGALPVTSPLAPGRVGYTKYENAQQTCPFDILYTIQIMTRQREFMSAANRMLLYVMKIYPPYCRVLVQDSIEDLRSYEAFSEQIAPLDEVGEVGSRMIGFSLSLRVEGELDINDPTTSSSVAQNLLIRTNQI